MASLWQAAATRSVLPSSAIEVLAVCYEQVSSLITTLMVVAECQAISVLADTLLLYRCYVVWDYDKRIVVGPALLLIAATICGYLFEGSLSTTLFTNSWVYPLTTLVLNLTLTILTGESRLIGLSELQTEDSCLTQASRIWFISRKTRRLLDGGHSQRYNVSLSILCGPIVTPAF